MRFTIIGGGIVGGGAGVIVCGVLWVTTGLGGMICFGVLGMGGAYVGSKAGEEAGEVIGDAVGDALSIENIPGVKCDQRGEHQQSDTPSDTPSLNDIGDIDDDDAEAGFEDEPVCYESNDVTEYCEDVDVQECEPAVE